MESKNNDEPSSDSTSFKDIEGETSFVSKVRDSVSGLFNSSISRLFGNTDKRSSTVHGKDNDDSREEQPPCKKTKCEDDNYQTNSLYEEYYMRSKSTNSTNSLRREPLPTYTNFEEPVAGPSGVRTHRKFDRTFTSSTLTQTDIINSDKCSESGDSTSGYSSVAKLCRKRTLAQAEPVGRTPFCITKEVSEAKRISGDAHTEHRSLFDTSNRSTESPNSSFVAKQQASPQLKNTSLSSRRPSFNSPNFVDRTIATSRIINSPFYNGPTIYGGASAYSRQDRESRRTQLKNSFSVKPVNKFTDKSSSTSLSKTARRILNTLEQYTAPLDDAKKADRTIGDQKGLYSKYIGANPYSIKKINMNSKKELQVPTLPELLTMKQKQRLQVATDNIRHIATSSNSSLNTEGYKIPEEVQQKHANKLRPKISSVRPKTQSTEVSESFTLKPVPLSLPENKLPKFDLVIPPPNSEKMISKEDTDKCKESELSLKSCKEMVKVSESHQIKDSDTQYVFSKPIVIAENVKSLIAINNFKFSDPLLENESATKSLKKGSDTEKKSVEAIVDLTSGTGDSIMDKFRPPKDSWECSVCLVRNKIEAVKCIACESMRPNDSSKTQQKPNLNSFGTQFFKKSNEWDCTTCLVRNKVDSEKCLACSAAKPSSLNEKISESKPIENKFKAPTDSWECQTCWVRNKNSLDKCIACESKRSINVTGKGVNSLKGQWECNTCLIKNRDDLKKCAACQTPREIMCTPLLSDVIKKQSGKWECPTCMVRNDNDVNKCPCCETSKPTVTLISKNTVSMFNFGVNKTQFSFGTVKDKVEDIKSLVPVSQVTTTITIVESKTTVASSAPPVISFGFKPNENEVKTTDSVLVAKPVPFTSATTDLKSTDTVLGSKKIESSLISQKTETNTKDPGGFQFKLPAPVAAQGVTPASKTSSPVNFRFGETPNNGDSKLSAFPKPASNQLFKFDAPKPTIATNNVDLQTTKPTEVAQKPSFDKNLFSFGKKESTNPFSAGTKENNSSATFVSGSAASTAPSKGFSFAPSATEQKTSGVTASSGGFPPMDAPKPNTFVFSAPSSGTAKPTNGGFNFGNPSLTNNQAAAFSFGANQLNSNSTQSTSGGFNFTAPAPTTGGFNFSAVPTLDGSIKPTFNFSGGAIPQFSATPTPTGEPVRKFKKAVRRAAQR